LNNESKEEVDWCAARRMQALDYLDSQDGLKHAGVGDWPAWHVFPHVSLWAVQSGTHPGSVGWWVICGDLPTDYCTANDCRHPRLAVKKIVDRWVDASRQMKPDDVNIGETGIPAQYKSLLESRAELLLDWVAKSDYWPD
jgi:hypothetical protein